MLRGFRRLASFLVVLVMIVTLLPQVPASAADDPLPEDEAVAILQEYGIVKGDPTGDLKLADRLTRAEAATVFVRSMNATDLAALLEDVVPFTDARGHWAAGAIAMVDRLGLMKGDGNGLFRPDDQITYVEIYTVLLRMVEQEPPGPWNPATIESKAKSLSITPPGANRSDVAIRRQVFVALATALSEVPVNGASTLLRKHLDQTPPTLVMSQTSLTTKDSRVTITGSAKGAVRVLVDGKPAQLDRKTGQFTASVSIDTGETIILVEALDAAKNKATKSISVVRQADISRLSVEGPDKIALGSTQKLEIKALDSRGNEVPLEGLTAEVTDDVAKFDLKTHRLTATGIGRGTLTLSAGRARDTFRFEVQGPSDKAASLEMLEINKGHALALDKETQVFVRVLDENGRVVTDDNFRPISLKVTGLSGVSLTVGNAMTERGVATFTVKGVREGEATFTASSSKLESVSQEVQFLRSPRIVLSTTAKEMKPDGTSEAVIRATLTNDEGKSVNNTSNADILIELTETGTDGDLTQAFLSIPRGRSTASESATYQAGIAPGTAKISGKVVSNHDYPVQTLNLPVTDSLAGVKWDISYSPSRPEPGEEVRVTLRVLDSRNRVVTTGSYAFQIKLTTSNDDPVVNGIPDGVTFGFEDSAYYPVDDGHSDSNSANDPYAVVGRTDRGTAVMTLTYNRSGAVEITPVGVDASYDAHHPSLGLGPASGSKGLYAPTTDVSFAGTAAGLMLTVDSDLGKDQPAGAVDRATRMTIRVKVVDDQGAVVPGYREYVTLTRTNDGQHVTSLQSASRQRTDDGIATFTIQASNTPGFDRYTASVGGLTDASVTVAVRTSELSAPEIIAIRGVREGGLSPVTGYVGPDADYMDIQLARQESVDPAEPTNWAIVKVYRQRESRPFFTSQAIDLNGVLPVVRIPRSALKPGLDYYEVTVDNGAGDSPRSPSVDTASQAMVADYRSTYQLTSASFDAEEGKLVLSSRGLSSRGTLMLDKFSVVKGDNVLSLDHPDVTYTISSSRVTLMLGDLAEELSPDVFYGNDVYVEAETGWFTSEDEFLIAEAYPEIPLEPMAVIHSGAIDQANKRLYLYGEGFRQGTIDYSLIGIGSDDGEPVFLRKGSSSSYDRVASLTDSQIILNLSTTTWEKLSELAGSSLYVTAKTGWLYEGSSRSGYKVGAITGTDHPVYTRVTLSSATYDSATGTLTLRGSGLNGVTIDPEKLIFKRTTTSAAWTPVKTGPVTSDSDSEVRIVLDPDDAEDFLSLFEGRNVFINTANGWMTDADGREVLPLPDYSILFSVRGN